MQKYLEICFAADPAHSSTLRSCLHQFSCCFSKLGAGRLPSPVANTLTVDKYLMQPHCKYLNYALDEEKTSDVLLQDLFTVKGHMTLKLWSFTCMMVSTTL